MDLIVLCSISRLVSLLAKQVDSVNKARLVEMKFSKRENLGRQIYPPSTILILSHPLLSSTFVSVGIIDDNKMKTSL